MQNTINNNNQRDLRNKDTLKKPSWLNDFVIEDLFITPGEEPSTYNQSVKSECSQEWLDAMHEELKNWLP